MLLTRRKKTIINVFLSTIFLFLSFYFFTSTSGESHTNLFVEVKSPVDDVYQVFYDIGNGFNENDSKVINVSNNDLFQSLQFSLPSNVKSLRFDFGTSPGTIYVKNITWNKTSREYEWSADMVVESHNYTNHIEHIGVENNLVKIKPSGDDPYFIIDDVENIDKYLNNNSFKIVISFIFSLLLSFILFWFLQITNLNVIQTINLKKFNSSLLPFAFIVILIIPSFVTIIGIDSNLSSVEKRDLAAKPKLNLREETYTDYIRKYETYINDNFGFRDKLIKWNNVIKVKYLKTSPINRVLIGKDGWLFYNDEGVTEDYRGVNHFDDIELETIKSNLEERKKWLEAQGIKFYITVAPNKHTIYPEYLPSNIKKHKEESRLDQLINYLEYNSDIDIIDLRKTLIKNKGEENLYRKNDTHWNDLGAFYAYSEIVNVIGEDFENIKPLSIGKYSLNYSSGGGDLAFMLSMNDILLEERINLDPTFKSAVKDIEIDKSIYPNPNRLVVKGNESISNSYKLLMFRDSFSNALIPYLSENFSSSIYVWDYAFNTDIIQHEKPDIVIHELAERYLHALLDENPEGMK
ncbi:hypothetical protein HNQ94_003051 [Salirhabdus euzebyi]|uniref:AlgX/AlgJ SGNH hydrolase-like domain-containing protein n=1 Tax=Salirhabdus euzebyi TaxID=394506 RepID=A0A841Q8F5_9BACI|nr:hypothetical protein [Salirhabdus euzebyi]MBB6454562.1 hypothetical protein [Salirhabdus euzebyi]